jgi:hypothetical protein
VIPHSQAQAAKFFVGLEPLEGAGPAIALADRRRQATTSFNQCSSMAHRATSSDMPRRFVRAF